MNTRTKKTSRPMIFTARSVRALLAGRKTQTRRIVKPQPQPRIDGMYYWESRRLDAGYCHTTQAACERLMAQCSPVVVGDRLWVKEAWQRFSNGDRESEARYTGCPHDVFYRADESDETSLPLSGRWRSPLFMPRWASRLTLCVTNVRVERLWDITEMDAIDEGAPQVDNPDYDEDDPCEDKPYSHVAGFADAWRELHGDKSWEENPWVWVLHFERVEP